MGLRVYWELCQKYEIGCANNLFEEVPNTVQRSENGQIEIWWDRPIETNVKYKHNKPDVILINWQDKEWTIVEFSVPRDKNVLLKNDKKIKRYIPLAKEISKVHGVSTKIVPIILYSLGTVTNQLKADLAVLRMERILRGMQTSVLIGTHNILRKVINSDRKEKEKGKRK